MSLALPLGLAALGALIPLVVLYLMKQKRIEEKVPANFLWAKAVEDLRASSLFQRFRAPLLFLLQAAAITLCALAAAGASLDLNIGQAPRHVILLLDRSASMKAKDAEGGRTRFEEARALAHDVVDGLASTDEMMLLAFDAQTEVVLAFTPDQTRLHEALDSLTARDLGTKPAQTLQTAIAYARESRGYDPEIVLISDGCVAEELPAVPYPVRYAKVGTSGANQGIAAVQLSRVPGEATQVFVRVDNGSAEPAKRTVTLRKGSEILDARIAEMGGDGDMTVWFELPEPETSAPLEMSVGLEGPDVLAADDVVPFVMRASTPRSGLVVRNEASIHLFPEKVQGLRPGLALTGVTPAEAEAQLTKGTEKIDLVIYDGVAPAQIPDVPGQMYIDCIPPGTALGSGGPMQDPVIVDWDRTHPITARCQFDDVMVYEATKLVGHERSLPLIQSTGGPLALLTPVPGREVVVVAFSPSRSNLWQKLAWPLFLANTFDHLLGKVSREGEEPLSPTGKPLTLDRAAAYTVTRPDGTKTEVAPDPMGRSVFAEAYQTGIYRFKPPQGAESLHAFAMIDASEVRVTPREEFVAGGAVVKSDPSGLRRNVLLRDPLLLAVLGVLLLEWAIWSGRR